MAKPFDYKRLSGNAAIYSMDGASSDMTYILDGTRIMLIADRSGNSAVNCLVLNGASGNYASFTALPAFGTGNFSVSCMVTPHSLTAYGTLLGGAANSFGLRVGNGATIAVAKNGIGVLATSTGTIVALRNYVIGYTRSGTTGTYYIDGVAAGTITDSNDYTVGVSEIGAIAAGTSILLAGAVSWVRVYSAALDASAMAADAAGAVQANNVFYPEFTRAAKLVSAITESSANAATVTINTSGDLGARISGARDLVQFTSSKQPIYVPSSDLEPGNILTEADDSPSFERDLASPPAEWSQIGNHVGTAVADATAPNGARVAEVVASGAGSWLGNAFYLTAAKARVPGAGYRISFYAKSISGNAVLDVFGTPRDYWVPPSTSTPSCNLTAAWQLFTFYYRPPSAGTHTLAWALQGAGTFRMDLVRVERTDPPGAFAYFDGSNDFVKSPPFQMNQPAAVHLVGSQVTWTDADTIFEGNDVGLGKLYQRTTSPSVQITGGSGTVLLPSNWSLGTRAVIASFFNGAVSSTRMNRDPAAVGSAGTANLGGLTVGSSPGGGSSSNITLCEAVLYSRIDGDAFQLPVNSALMRKWNVP